MLGIGRKFPAFRLTAVVGNDVHSAFKDFDEKSFPGKWLVVFFWPKDFSFVCPTEIAGFGRLDRDFADRLIVIVSWILCGIEAANRQDSIPQNNVGVLARDALIPRHGPAVLGQSAQTNGFSDGNRAMPFQRRVGTNGDQFQFRIHRRRGSCYGENGGGTGRNVDK